MKRALSAFMFVLLLVNTLAFAVNTQNVRASGTIYIRADGSIDPPTAPIQRDGNLYTFTDDIYDSIVVERDNIIVDGAGCTIHGPGDAGIELVSRSNVTIKNLKAITFNSGIRLRNSSNNSISGNNLANNIVDGVYVYESSNYNIIYENNITNNWFGVSLDDSSFNTLIGNVLNSNTYDFRVYGDEQGNFIQSIDVSNLVDGKPVYYLVNQKDLVINSVTHPQLGYLALVNCANITVEDLTLENNGQGLLLAYTNNSEIVGNSITNNWYGVFLQSSNYNIISGNDIANNRYGDGVLVYKSSNNTVSGNNMTNNDSGVVLMSSSDNTISGNNITKNGWRGVWLDSSSNSTIYHNNFIDNTEQVASHDSRSFWDDGYPSGGNYWSDYTGVDLYGGPYQNETGSDGIGDTSYVVDEENIDRYPLFAPFVSLTGDLNGDRWVNAEDALQLGKSFGLRSWEPGWSQDADLNKDGYVNAKDVVLLGTHFGEHT